MNARLAAASTAVVVALALAVAWIFAMPLERAFVLSPAIVIGGGIVAMTALLLTRAALESVRELGHPRRFWIGFAVALVLIGILSALGVTLPREG